MLMFMNLVMKYGTGMITREPDKGWGCNGEERYANGISQHIQNYNCGTQAGQTVQILVP